MEGVDAVWGEEGDDGMLAYIKGLYEEQPRPVLLAGHSLGAALATIAAARLAAVHEIPIHGVYTIGSPRWVVIGRAFVPAAAAPRSSDRAPLYAWHLIFSWRVNRVCPECSHQWCVRHGSRWCKPVSSPGTYLVRYACVEQGFRS